MKKFLILVLILVAILIIASCKKLHSPAVPAVTQTPAVPAPTPIAFYTDLVSVPGGTFTQTDGTNSFSHTISAFKMGKYKVPYYLWYTVYQWAVANGYTFQNAGAEGSNGTAGAAPTSAEYQPVTTVNWRDAIVWCNAFSRETGLTPVYYSDSGLTTAINSSVNGAYGTTTCTAAGCYDNPYVNWNADGYRLPTEGEHQYAASYIDGTNWTPYDYASGATDTVSDIPATEVVAWFSSNCFSTQAVGTLAANALGIYDMSGDAWELCWDWFGTYPTTAQINYTGPASGSLRVMRGGSFNTAFYVAYLLQVGDRANNSAYSAVINAGFRFAKTY